MRTPPPRSFAPFLLLCTLAACGGGGGDGSPAPMSVPAVTAGDSISFVSFDRPGTVLVETSDPAAVVVASPPTVEFRSAGEHTVTLRAPDGAESTVRVLVLAAPATVLSFDVHPTLPLGEPTTFAAPALLRALDPFGNVDTSFATPVRIRSDDAVVRGLDGPEGDRVLSFDDGVADLAGRLQLEFPAPVATTRLRAEADDGITGASESITLLDGAPPVRAVADYRDRNNNTAVDEGDSVTFGFEGEAGAGALAVVDALGLGVSAPGPEAGQVTVTLAAGVVLVPGETVLDLGEAGSTRVHPMPVDLGERLGGTKRTENVALADLNGDGFLDLVFANHGTSDYHLGDGTGRYASEPSGIVGTTNGATSVVAADFDGDGTIDLVFGAGSSARVFLNDGAAGFTSAGPALPAPDTVDDVAAADLDGDGDRDIVVASRRSNRVYRNLGNGTFERTQEFDSYYTQSIALADLDGDGDVD